MIDIKTVNFAHFKCINLLKIYLVFWGFEYDFFWNKNSAIKNLVKKNLIQEVKWLAYILFLFIWFCT